MANNKLAQEGKGKGQWKAAAAAPCRRRWQLKRRRQWAVRNIRDRYVDLSDQCEQATAALAVLFLLVSSAGLLLQFPCVNSQTETDRKRREREHKFELRPPPLSLSLSLYPRPFKKTTTAVTATRATSWLLLLRRRRRRVRKYGKRGSRLCLLGTAYSENIVAPSLPFSHLAKKINRDSHFIVKRKKKLKKNLLKNFHFGKANNDDWCWCCSIS